MTSIDFNNIDCKTGNHQHCPGAWSGYKMEFACCCDCHNKNLKALKSVGQPNAPEVSFQKDIQNDN